MTPDVPPPQAPQGSPASQAPQAPKPIAHVEFKAMLLLLFTALLVLGFVNLLTMAYMAEVFTRTGSVRYGKGFVGRVVTRSFMGAQVRLGVDVAGQGVVALVPPLQAEGISVGDSVTLHVPSRALWVLPA